MSVITFSRQFLKAHPRSGDPTYFVEKILEGLGIDYTSDAYLTNLSIWNAKKLADGRLTLGDLKYFRDSLSGQDHGDKGHTIRNGERFKAGDTFNPVVWSNKPYASPQIQFAPELIVKRTYEFSYDGDWFLLNKMIPLKGKLPEIAKNDGLSLNDFKAWFPKPFQGQIICWSDKVEY